MRDGAEQRIPAADLVPGDLMLLAEGDHISADGRLVRTVELQADQSTLTGESRPVRKSAEAVSATGLTRAELPNLVFAGTSVAAGSGAAFVYATGMQTEFGKIANLTQSLGEELSPLQKEIAVVTRIVSVIAVVIGVLFFILAVAIAGIRSGRVVAGTHVRAKVALDFRVGPADRLRGTHIGASQHNAQREQDQSMFEQETRHD